MIPTLALNEISQCWQEATAEAMEPVMAEDVFSSYMVVLWQPGRNPLKIKLCSFC